ncbi:MAG TPA: methyltransferase domain-containing protein, partial [Verrucomicrobiae bacterium]|nr:methyltransferase domain-containing protein [Verrucomicrobiae bacterium]
MEREARLREKLISQLRRSGALHSERVAAALSRVPRHRFVPASSPEEAYADQAIALKLAAGEVISSVSQPSMLAQMLELLDAEPGDRILEIGTGSGYNAALLAELAGEGGAVTTVELDPELARFARRALAELGYARVRTVLGDGGEPLGEPGAYDRIVVSARCEDVARAWWEALPEGGRLVVPLRLEGAGEFAVGF